MSRLAAFSLWTVAVLFHLFVVSSPLRAADSVYLKNSHGVNPMGAFTQQVPIEIPPGTAGLQPSLSLVYNSQGANGLLGKGWSISGLSVITRCSATVAQGDIDSTTHHRGVDLATTDRFCLDGQKLIAYSGAYGANGTEYRTETESFRRVYSYGTAGSGPSYFLVLTRSGQSIYYGRCPDCSGGPTTDSQILGGSAGNAVIWALAEVKDLETNYYTITYTNDTTNGQYYPIEIDYTGNSAASTTPYNKVTFSYTSPGPTPTPGRLDIAPDYRNDAQLKTTVLMTDVKTYAHGTQVMDYQLSYGGSSYGTSPIPVSTLTGNSLLTSVKPLSGDGTEYLQPLTFGWNAGGGFTAAMPSPSPTTVSLSTSNDSSVPISGYLAGDFNGDGVTDYIQLKVGGTSAGVCFGIYRGTGFNCTNYSLPVTLTDPATGTVTPNPLFVVGDFDGDGLADFALIEPNAISSAGAMEVCYSQGDGHFTCASKTGPNSQTPIVVGDFNGDGLTDVVEVDGFGDIETCFSQGRSTNNNCTVTGPTSGAAITAGYPDPILSGDFDGDGLMDLIQPANASNGAVACYSNSDGTYDCESKSFPPIVLTAGGQTGWFIGDFNGDGVADFARYSLTAYSGYPGTELCLSIGRGQNPNCAMISSDVPTYGGLGASVLTPFAEIDVNGDGRSDIVTDTGSSWQICYLGSDASINCRLVAKSTGSVVVEGNFTGGGAASILTTSPSASSASLTSVPPFYPDLLTTITNGLGAITTVAYAPLTDSSIYTNTHFSAPSSYPTQDVQNSAYVVSSLQEPDGVGGSRLIAYSYAGAKSDLQGRGFLGFAQVISQDIAAGKQTETDFNQAYPYIGTPTNTYQRILLDGSWSPISTSSYTYSYTNYGGTLEFPYLSQQIDRSYDFVSGALNSTITTQNTFNSLGNQTSSTVTTSDGYTKVTTNTFSNFMGSPGSGIWYLGQPSTTTQQNTNPSGATVTRSTQFTFGNSSYPNELTQEQLQPGGTDYLTKSYSYDTFGNRVQASVTGSDASGPMPTRTTTYTYDANGQFPLTITNALSQSQHLTYYYEWGTIRTQQDLNGLTTHFDYDVLGRKVKERRPDGTETDTTYSPLCTSSCGSETYHVVVSNIVTATLATYKPTVTAYFDLLDREFQRSTGGFGSNTIWRFRTYDRLGRLESMSRDMYLVDAPQYTTFGYDNADRLLVEGSPDGSRRTWSYNGLLTTITNNNGQPRTEIRDALGQLVTVFDATGQRTLYTYDPFGNLATTLDPDGHQIVLSYDVMGRKVTQVDPDLGTWSFTYNGAGEMLTQTDAKGHTETRTYDNLGRLATRSATEFNTTWTYDPTNGIGKLGSVVGSTGIRKDYSYDSLSRLSTETSTLDTTYVMTYGYDSASRIEQVTYPTSFAVKYAYDSNGYLTDLKNASTLATLWQRNSQNADNLPLSESFGNGVTTASSYYGPTGRLHTVVATPTVGNPVQNLTLSYDSLGNVLGRIDLINQSSGETLGESYGYDNLNRLRTSSNPRVSAAFTYDRLGNMVAKSDVGKMTYGNGTSGSPLHAVMSTSGPTSFSFTYDNNGNMLTGEGRTLTWTSFNKPATIANASNTITFSYDPNFERYKESETTCTDYLGNTSSSCTKYMINPAQGTGVHFEKEITGTVTTYRHFIQAGPGNVIGVYTTRSDGTTDTRYFHKDHLSSIVVTTDERGAVVERSSYDPFGKRRNVVGSDDLNNLLRSISSHQGFTEHEHLDDGGMGLINMNGRVYDPRLGRFMSPDPYVQSPSNLQNLNRYSYVVNNPTSSIDPSGYWFMNDVVNWFKDNSKTVFTVLAAVAVVAVSAVTFGGAALGLATLVGSEFAGTTFGAIGIGVLAGAASGAVAGALSSTLMGGGFSWQAVGMGALTGGIAGGIGAVASGLGSSAAAIAGRIGLGALSGGVTNWAQAVASGHGSWNAFLQGAAMGAIVSGASIGVEYLSESSPTVDNTNGAGEERASSVSDASVEGSDVGDQGKGYAMGGARPRSTTSGSEMQTTPIDAMPPKTPPSGNPGRQNTPPPHHDGNPDPNRPYGGYTVGMLSLLGGF